ncbi:PucR family transcriptional regulator [Halalkalibacter hemicellulosilyticus]|uniref:Transcriptional regulator n=1 Tax=Halalkalibacter hemicellulosilyticusJCM 9152 TaxID=1236971 RepID=W4QK84_9BACI|nr:PucR family transcriptional regulator [Halalkalibacter hemicellulosilyticus]GAE32048.1 transcriptional regulator [Halalkalibacter hemicellulosilyticusJCM 9152]
MELNDILQQSLLKDSTVVAGHQGLNRKVESVNMMDAPDIMNYLKENQLLFTTAYSIKNRPDILLELVRSMAKQGCAGLGLKTKRFIKVIPQAVIQLANEMNLPIIELPMHRSLGDLVNETLKIILEARTEELHYALDIHRKFTDMIISGKGLFEVIDRLSKLVHAKVMLLNHRLETITSSPKFDEVFCYQIATHINEEMKARDLFFEEKLVLHVQFSQYKEKHSATLFPVQTNTYQKGFMVVFKTISPQDSTTNLAIEQAANVVSFELMKLHALEQNSRRLKNEFFADLLEGSYSSTEDIANRGRHYGLKKNHQYMCIVCKMDDDNHFTSGDDPMVLYSDSIYEHLETLLRYYQQDFILFTKGDLFLIIVEVKGFGEAAEQKITANLQEIQREFLDTFFISLSFGVGNVAEQLVTIPMSYQEALDALRSGYRLKKKLFIQTCHTKEVTELLRTIPSQKLKDFYLSSLKDLAYSTERDKQELLETLSVYIEKNCQISETSKELFIHRNTVIYRIKKCESLLNVDLKDASHIHKLRTALLVGTFI